MLDWQHLVYVYDHNTSTRTLYVNGMQITPYTNSGNTPYSCEGGPFVIGDLPYAFTNTDHTWRVI